MIHHDSFPPRFTYHYIFYAKEKVLRLAKIFARDGRLLFIKSYAVPLLFMNVTSYTYQIQALYTHIQNDISTLDNGWVPSASTLPTLSVRIWGSRSEASSIYSFNCFAPTSSSLDSDINVIILFIAFFYYIAQDYHYLVLLSIFFSEFLCITYTKKAAITDCLFFRISPKCRSLSSDS